MRGNERVENQIRYNRLNSILRVSEALESSLKEKQDNLNERKSIQSLMGDNYKLVAFISVVAWINSLVGDVALSHFSMVVALIIFGASYFSIQRRLKAEEKEVNIQVALHEAISLVEEHCEAKDKYHWYFLEFRREVFPSEEACAKSFIEACSKIEIKMDYDEKETIRAIGSTSGVLSQFRKPVQA